MGRRRERGSSDDESISLLNATECEHVVVPWLPDTYLLDSPADCKMLIDIEEKRLANAAQGSSTEKPNNTGLWIYKPSCYNRGRGIKVVKGLEALKSLCYGVQTNDPDTTVPPAKGIIQQYIENPLLIPRINPETGLLGGHKFDIRCYLLIARNDPTYLAFYHPGYCRLTLIPYSDDESTLDDPTIHLTNAAIQKQGPLYQSMKEFQVI